MGIGPAAKDAKMGDRGFPIVEGFKGSLTRESSRGRSIESVQEAGEGFTPEASRKMRVGQQRGDTFI
jgi:hypothetical protein